MPTLKEILREWLEDHEYDGFYSGFSCHCHLDNLMPGMCYHSDCLPGYAMGDAEDWIIGAGKEEK